uniref:Putative ovule protein n=1 Tax=Solanum chacoense TaxID=4108 RepID=A0A0V0GQ39_SOLCH
MCAIEEPKDLAYMTVEPMESSLQAYEEKNKRRKEEPLEQLLKTKYPIKIKEVKKDITLVEEQKASTTTLTMKGEANNHLEVVVVDNEEEDHVAIIKVPTK